MRREQCEFSERSRPDGCASRSRRCVFPSPGVPGRGEQDNGRLLREAHPRPIGSVATLAVVGGFAENRPWKAWEEGEPSACSSPPAPIPWGVRENPTPFPGRWRREGLHQRQRAEGGRPRSSLSGATEGRRVDPSLWSCAATSRWTASPACNRRLPLRIDPEQTVADAVGLMRERRVGCLLVCRGDRLLGVFTERDLMRRVLAAGLPLATPVAACMTPDPVVVRPKEPIGRPPYGPHGRGRISSFAGGGRGRRGRRGRAVGLGRIVHLPGRALPGHRLQTSRPTRTVFRRSAEVGV